METTAIQPTVEQVWEWLNEVYDPEIPVISVVDLGIVRDVRWQDKADDRELVVTITPTYSGCPATRVIASDIESVVSPAVMHGQENGELVVVHGHVELAVGWTLNAVVTLVGVVVVGDDMQVHAATFLPVQSRRP